MSTMSGSDEYKHLYDEIGRNSQISQHVFVANVAVTSALIGYGLDSGIGPIFLAPFAIIVPSLFFLTSQLEATTRIAAYIAVFLEEGSRDINWETRWLALRRQGFLPARRKYTLSLSGLYGLISIVCVLLALRYWTYDLRWFVGAVTPIALLVAWGIRSVVNAFSLSLVEAYMEAWKKLRSEEGD